MELPVYCAICSASASRITSYNVCYTKLLRNTYVYRQALIRNPSSPVYNEDGTYNEDFNKFQYYNPVEIQNELIGDTRTKYARITGNITVEPVNGWKTNLMLSREEQESTSQNYYTSDFYSQATADRNNFV